MPLSEEELRLLEQMERAMSEEDPKFASALRGTTVNRATRGRIIISAVAFLAGIAILMTGAVTQLTWVGIIGFVVMLAAAMVGLTAWRTRNAVETPSAQQQSWVPDHPSGFDVIEGGRKTRKPRRQKSSGTFVQRMEQRWQRRRDQRDGY